MSNRPLFVVSLDFELYWGMFDKVTLDTYGENIKGVHEAIPELLSLFEKYGVHATWAVVGMLMCRSKDELMSLLPEPSLRPQYDDMRLSAYEHILHTNIGENEQNDPYHYGHSLVEMILRTQHQELGSHTFSHYYAQDGSNNGEAIFAADCAAFRNVSERFGAKITSIVFPRNQTSPEALRVCKQFGYQVYRGTPDHFLYTGKKEKEQTNIFLRILRLIDAYINISGHHSYPINSVSEPILSNVPGSRFLRPYSHSLRLIERLRIARIKKSMTYAATHGEVFHLWWHPHNFGTNRKENLANLIEILEHFKDLQTLYGMESATMQEVATRANESAASVS